MPQIQRRVSRPRERESAVRDTVTESAHRRVAARGGGRGTRGGAASPVPGVRRVAVGVRCADRRTGRTRTAERAGTRHGDMTWSCVGSVGDVCGSAARPRAARGERPRSSCATQTRMGDGVRHDFSWSRYYHARTATRSATWSTDAHEQRVYTERDKIMRILEWSGMEWNGF